MNPLFLLLPALLAGAAAAEPLPQARPRRLREDEDAWEERWDAATRAEEERVALAKTRAQAKRDRKAAARLRVGRSP